MMVSRTIETLIIVADEALPSGHPAGGPLDGALAWQHREARVLVGMADDF
jgi:hypothetical protein